MKKLFIKHEIGEHFLKPKYAQLLGTPPQVSSAIPGFVICLEYPIPKLTATTSRLLLEWLGSVLSTAQWVHRD